MKIDIHDRGILQDTFNHLDILLGQRICFQSRSIRFSCCCLQIELSVNKISLRCDWPLTPPSTGMISPVIQRASLLQRNRIATSNVQWNATYCRWTRRSLPLPTSHPVPSIFIRFWLTRACLISSVIPRPLTIGVKTIPGQTQLTLMFSGPCWAAIARVIWMIAPFDVGYSRLGFPPSTWMILASTTYNQMERWHIQPLTEDILTIAPRPFFRNSGMTCRHMSTILVTLILKSRSQAFISIFVASPIAPPTPTREFQHQQKFMVQWLS